MVSSKMSALITVVLMILVATTTTKVAEGQGTPSCASNLVPCADYLNSTHPPASCCNPLRVAVTTQLDCLCKLYENPALLAAFKINITQALKLPGYCGIPGNISACNAQAPGSSASETPPAQSGGKDNNGVGKIAGTGLTSLLLALASLMLS
ncbi:non-specific lipid transfer protein GPI-anchored 7 isoform X1 [Coffea arabica]|uniref:Non-specific lipid transfer protein GPI-anchored 7 isoform X1 n=1 Tax=Coffea arabica TaxID=13443 RepID=A0A6P6U3G3_COFAR|nr:lipid transfer-like protein VAS [Coffea arabica]